jgi:hypothetical protein
VHAPQDVEEVKDVPPALKVPTPQGTPAAEPAGQKLPAGHVACMVLVVACGHT